MWDQINRGWISESRTSAPQTLASCCVSPQRRKKRNQPTSGTYEDSYKGRNIRQLCKTSERREV